jgi:RNA polymerase sigma factor (TIGR02999 family)
MPGDDVTTLLQRWGQGDRAALDHLMPLVYDELRRLAASRLRRERSGNSLQSSALVNEAYLRLVNQHGVQWQNRAHFFAIAAQMIRRILVDHARAQHRDKRGGGVETILLDEALHHGEPSEEARGVEMIALDTALHGLEKLDPEQSRIVELRFFAGLTVEETAEAMHLSRTTVNRHWVTARAWLIRELGGSASTSA